jgi:hypothetical protein
VGKSRQVKTDVVCVQCEAQGHATWSSEPRILETLSGAFFNPAGTTSGTIEVWCNTCGATNFIHGT